MRASVEGLVVAASMLPALLGALPGCNEVPARTASRGATHASSVASAADRRRAAPQSVSDGGAAARLSAWRVEESCARNWAKGADGDWVAGLSRAAEMCASGLSPLRETPVEISVDPTHPADMTFHVDGPSACLRVVLVSSADAFEVSVTRGADLLAKASSACHVLALPQDGPVCVVGPTDLRVTLAATDLAGAVGRNAGSNRAAINVWTTRGE